MKYVDFIGQDILINDWVAGMHSGMQTPYIYEVIGFTPKRVRLKCPDTEKIITKDPKEMVKLPDAVDKQIQSDVYDLLGRKLEVGDYAFGSNGQHVNAILFEIISIKARRVEVEAHSRRWGGEIIRNGHDLIKITDPSIITMFLLSS